MANIFSFLLKIKIILFLIAFLSIIYVDAQENAISIKAHLFPKKNIVEIQQNITFFNKSKDTLQNIFLHNWANSFQNNETPLGKRFLEDYKKDFYFSKEKNRGNTKIYNLSINYVASSFKELKNQPDILKVALHNPLYPNDSLVVNVTYVVKIPDAKFTGYGKTPMGYHLRFWYITPAVYKNGWQLMSNLNMDDLYQDIANFTIDIDVPSKYNVESNLYQYKTQKGKINNYYLVGKNKKDIILHIDTRKIFNDFQTQNTLVRTDIFDKEIDHKNTSKIIAREVKFIEDFIGKHPNTEILIDGGTVNKNSLQEIYGLPDWLNPYPKHFRWEMRFFKALTSKYIDDVLLLNKRKDYWLNNGIKTFLMMEYLKKYYPNVTVLGKYSKIWGVKTYNLAKLKQSDKFSFLYQFSARKFYDQPLTTSADSLSNFNRKVISQYKAGLGLKYLQDFVGDSILKISLKEFYENNKLKISNSNSFSKILQKKTDKDLSWFFEDYIKTNKKIDYTIKKIEQKKDSLQITIKNNRKFTAPVALYGVNNKKIVFKKWITGIDSTKTITIEKGKFDRLSLNYENIYPEYNTLDNWKSIKRRLLNKPLQFRFLQDIENPYYNQIYFQPEFSYNYYDGVIISSSFHNEPIIAHNLGLYISPSYATKSNSLTGGFNLSYSHYPSKKSSIYRTIYGVSGSYSHYDKSLAYRSFNSYVKFEFKRNSLRDVGGQFLNINISSINKEIPKNVVATDKDKYAVLGIHYFKSKPNVIKGIQYDIGGELGKKFSKFTAEFRYRQLTGKHRRMDFRVFAGLFLHNKTNGDYFSFGLDRANDYLFQLNYFGRSEEIGFFSQQFILAEGGFKSKLNTRFANKYITAFNSSIGIWRWIEVYNDIALLKNKGKKIYKAYENGIHLNFVPNILEVYFPFYSNNGWEITQAAYPQKMRFVLTLDIDAIYNFVRRGFL